MAALLSALPLLSPCPAAAQGIRGEASFTTTGGYGRLVIRMDTEIEAQARLAGGVLVIEFKQPVDVPVERLATGARDYIGAARRDPDGRALRFALARKVKLSTMTAGERLFVDLLPEDWTGEPPGLPREVVEDLARRARDAERLAKQRIAAEQQSARPSVRVRVASQPTFTRYIFELPELTGVTTDRAKDGLTLSFSSTLRFDLADAKLALPDAVSAVDASNSGDTTAVRFAFGRPVDIRTFREDTNFVVDVSPIDAPAARASARSLPPASPRRQPCRPKPRQRKPRRCLLATPPPQPAKAEAVAVPAIAATEPPKPARAAPNDDPNHPVIAELRRQGDNLRLFFPFAAPTPAAVFQRADTLWLVFDTRLTIDIGALANDMSHTIRSATVAREDDAQVVRIKLERPRLVSVDADDSGWSVSVGDSMQAVSKPLALVRHIVAPGRASVIIPFEDPRRAHWLTDPDVGDKLLAVTGIGPARGLVRAQDFVEFRALASAQGIAIQPLPTI